MSNLVKAEFYYLFRNVRFYVFLGIIIAYDLVAMIWNPRFEMSGNNNLMLSFTQGIALIFVAILLLEFSHKDFTNKTMKNYVGCGISLFRVYFAKLLVCMTAVLIILLVANICEQIGYVVIGDNTFDNIRYGDILIRTFCTLLQCSVVFFICSLISNGAISIIVSIFYLVGLQLVFQLVPVKALNSLDDFLLANITNEISHFSQIPVDCAVPVELRLCISIVIVAALAFLGAFLYSKREVK